MNLALIKIVRCALPLVAAALFATGCQTYQQQNKVIVYWNQGDLTNAVVEAKKQADHNANDKDAIIWRLEDGAVLRAAGLLKQKERRD